MTSVLVCPEVNLMSMSSDFSDVSARNDRGGVDREGGISTPSGVFCRVRSASEVDQLWYRRRLRTSLSSSSPGSSSSSSPSPALASSSSAAACTTLDTLLETGGSAE